ncbi:S41 family peptidase [Pelagibius sp. Alg239-R121]|uniref:S41 family peptidase n=1 Tax=Pelagibius sp. Alg239-R121 TaxID=2993448 RepID=UPI0024A74407|nr:S41 family peptidase [Pelagibius sp. Alg239-R121]
MLKLQKAAALAAVVLLFPLGSAVAQDNEQHSETYRQLKLFGDVFERVRSDYVEQATDEELIESAIQGMLSSLDPHSSYLNEKSFKDMRVQTRGEFGGLGIEVTMENGFVKVVSPIDDTPAFRAGVQAGDFITHLDGEAVLGLTLAEAVERMRGLVNTDLKVTIRREGVDPFDLVITRDVIKVRSVRSRVEGNIGYVRVTSFNEQSTPGVEAAITDIKKELGSNLSGLVLDLRNNPGGLLTEAISISDAFLEQGEIVSTRGRESEDTQRYNARAGDLVDGLPIVVLINGGSASASEIVAGALQDHRRAIILGTKSFGKGSVQTIIPLAGHGAMRLTTARYFTPSGGSIQAKGIVPDIEVEQARIEALTSGPQRSEADLRGALANPGTTGGGEDSQPAADGEANANTEEAPADYQLARAIDLLRGLSLFSERATN